MEKKYNKDGKESKRTWYSRWCKYKELLPSLTAGVEDGLSYDEFTKKCLDELEQLLSERTAKVKLEALRELSYEIDGAELDSYIDEHKDYFNKLGKSVWKKIKLLKEEE